MTATDFRPALTACIERLMPDHIPSLARITWEPVSEPTPCERCGTTVVLILWHGKRAWCEVTAEGLAERLYDVAGAERTRLNVHNPGRCGVAREEALKPKQLAMDFA